MGLGYRPLLTYWCRQGARREWSVRPVRYLPVSRFCLVQTWRRWRARPAWPPVWHRRLPHCLREFVPAPRDSVTPARSDSVLRARAVVAPLGHAGLAPGRVAPARQDVAQLEDAARLADAEPPPDVLLAPSAQAL